MEDCDETVVCSADGLRVPTVQISVGTDPIPVLNMNSPD